MKKSFPKIGAFKTVIFKFVPFVYNSINKVMGPNWGLHTSFKNIVGMAPKSLAKRECNVATRNRIPDDPIGEGQVIDPQSRRNISHIKGSKSLVIG